MRRAPRWLLFTVIVLVLALGTFSSLAIGTARQSLPQVSGRLVVPGLGAPVEVLRDRYGVPQIYADNADDLFQAQGYVNAQDRFFEMDVRRHLAAGRLSELLGPSRVQVDAYARTLGWRRTAEAELSLASSSTRRALDAYAAGVNAYLHSRPTTDLSLEYSLLAAQGLEYEPEDWTAVDTLAWLKVVAWQLGSNHEQEAERSLVTATVGTDRAASLYPRFPLDGFDPILSRGAVTGGTFDPTAAGTPAPGAGTAVQVQAALDAVASVRSLDRSLNEVLGAPGLGGETSASAWVVSGSRTATGRPLLGNDPQLAVAIPSAFTQVGLHCRVASAACAYDVTGFALAGVPGVTVGRNTTVAWGLSGSRVDAQDLVLEDVVGDSVREGAGFMPLESRVESLTVRGEDQPRTLTVRTGRHGPLVSDIVPQLARPGTTELGDRHEAVAVRWTGTAPGRTMDALLALDRARSFEQFRAAAALVGAPSLSLLYADVAGNIGYQLAGAVPVRGRGDGRLPAPGWDPAYDWTGTVAAKALPWTYNPPAGVIVAANQPVTGQVYPHLLGSDFSYGWRSQQLTDRLADADPLTVDQAQGLFSDDTSRVAADLVPTLLKIKVSDSWVAEGQRTMVGWDYTATADSAAAAYFNVVVHNVLKATFRDELPADLWPTTSDRWYAVLATLMKQPKNPWWDDVTTPGKVETRDDILLRAMTDARKEITSLMARDTDEWQWGRLHHVRLRSPWFGRAWFRPVRALFNRGHYPVGGGVAALDNTSYDDRLGYDVVRAPALRILADLSGADGSRWVNQSGVSGHAFDEHYDDQTQLWATGRLWPLVTSRAAVETATTTRLDLVPNG
ncbi:MAG: peptidase family protein [Friedmanniella sp.]|nr:peptidase family protein [Friedmanniella sp.]